MTPDIPAIDDAGSSLSSWLKVAPEVQQAMATRQPVLAFETTVLSFGLPYPANMRVGRQCQEIARQAGCVPATLGLMDGMVHVGISDEQMAEFCAEGARVTKVNLQNMAAAAVRKEAGAFTVAASMQVCAAAGIEVFATGGIGGVHHDYAKCHDVSSDMMAFTRYPVAVVCAGIKSILDVPATLEQLETLGIPVVGYKTDRMPLFHSRESLYPLETYSNCLEETAKMVRAHWRMGGRGVLVVTPIPEEHAIDMNELQEWIAGAHRAAQIGRVTGKAVTPFLLKKLEELSHGRSLTSNVALLENNAVVAAKLARIMAA
jgi:pseudouridine-5'-phosphate glycosidase